MPSTHRHAYVLLVDDDQSILDLMEFELQKEGVPTLSVGNASACLEALETERLSAVVLDLGLPDLPGVDVLQRIRRSHPELPVVVVTGTEDVSMAVECMRLGAADFLQKPFERTRLLASVRNAHATGLLRRRLQDYESDERSILGESPAIERTRAFLSKAARTDVTVLIHGESGTGKELFARAIHAGSDSAGGPFVALNCAAIPQNLVESELFGHVRGAFSGATGNRAGLFEQATGGTIFLDEVGELPLEIQARLLRVLQERVVRPVGGSKEREIDARVVVATNRVLEDEVREGRFREDLFYRLSVFPIELPPLRAREGDVELLANHFLEGIRREARSSSTTPSGFSEAARAALLAHPWPGNVRELENAIQRAVILEEGPLIDLDSLPDEVVCGAFEGSIEEHPGERHDGGFGRRREDGKIQTMEQEERRIFQGALEACEWNVREAATALGIGRATLYRRIQAYKLEPRKGGAPGAQ